MLMENSTEEGPVCPECGQTYGFRVGETVEYDSRTVQPARKGTDFRHTRDRDGANHSNPGRTNFYLEALDRDVKKPHENPAIGLRRWPPKATSKPAIQTALSPRRTSPARNSGAWGSPDDIAPAVVYFASNDSKWVPGETLFVTGGFR
jgi:NAD(P)-dependent dehydrogenase (short-subunit alcohol dehydrogenase family)